MGKCQEGGSLDHMEEYVQFGKKLPIVFQSGRAILHPTRKKWESCGSALSPVLGGVCILEFGILMGV